MTVLKEAAAHSETLPDSNDELVYLVSYGRKTLRKHIVKLRFVPWTRDTICVLTIERDSSAPDWVQNLFSSASKAPCEFASKNHYGLITRASILISEEDALVAAKKFNQKYGKAFTKEYSKYYKNAKPVLLEYTEIIEKPERLVTQLEFDLQARNYTANILKNPISLWQREVTIEHLSRIFKPGRTVLEIGCGTGLETIPISEKGVNVVALDISQEMLDILDSRVRERNIRARIRTRQLSSSEISEIKSDSLFPPGGFDGAFSNFGAVNLEKNLKEFSKELSSILKPGALVSFAVWNRFCLTDASLRFLKLKGPMFRERFSGRVKASGESKYSLDTMTYTPSEYYSHFATEFQINSIFALPALLVPPSEYASKLSFLLKLRRLDYWLGRLPLFRRIGDNYVITMQKRREKECPI